MDANGTDVFLSNQSNEANDASVNATNDSKDTDHTSDIAFSTIFSLIYVIGTVGNGLVLFVILRYTKMKTVTNVYILNLAIADLSLLTGLPFLMVTMTVKHWIFGLVMCKLFYTTYGINLFTGVFFICVLSADRYLAVCHPMKTQYRSPVVSYVVVGTVWIMSLLIMIPIYMYAELQSQGNDTDRVSCSINWPKQGPFPPEKAFIWYSFLLAFCIPLVLSSVFYAMVVIRLKSVGPANRTREKKRRTRKVTVMVLTVIAVYFVCWLPYWIFQADLVLPQDSAEDKNESQPEYKKLMLNVFTILTYSNSMMNPILYTFMSENFRRSFTKAFRCVRSVDVDRSLIPENSAFPRACEQENCNKLNCRRHTIHNDDDNVDNTVTTSIPMVERHDQDSDGKQSNGTNGNSFLDNEVEEIDG